MSWHASLENPKILQIDDSISKAENDSFITAFCNLLERYEIEENPLKLSQKLKDDNVNILSWATITSYYPDIFLASVGLPATWPTNINSIVRFKALNPANGDEMDHYCLIADIDNHTFIDSFDGELKKSEVYGEPLSYATYRNPMMDKPVAQLAPSKEVIPEIDIFHKNLDSTARTYTMKEGDNIWEVALRLSLSGADLIDYNDIEDSSNVPAGTVLYLPYKTKIKDRPPINYEILDEVKKMHVSKQPGAKKWSYGNATKWTDLHSSGFYRYGTNVDVVAIVRVPIGDDEMAAYYLDRSSFGEYSTTGKVAFTTGYNWSDLASGYFVPEPKQKIAEVVPAHIEAEVPEVIEESEDALVETPVLAEPNIWKTTYKSFPQPVRFIARRAILVHEFDTRRPDRMLMNNQEVVIAGVFNRNNLTYGRPSGSVKYGYWFGIPMSDLISEDELYNTRVSLSTRATMRHAHLTLEERGVVALSKVLSVYTKFAAWIGQNKQNKG